MKRIMIACVALAAFAAPAFAADRPYELKDTRTTSHSTSEKPQSANFTRPVSIRQRTIVVVWQWRLRL